MIRKLLCNWFGHRWQPVWDGGPTAKSLPIEVCLRCRENGWRL